MYRLAGAITAEQLYDVARYAFAEMLRAGYTRVVEFHYLHHDPEGGRSRETADAFEWERVAEHYREVFCELGL